MNKNLSRHKTNIKLIKIKKSNKYNIFFGIIIILLITLIISTSYSYSFKEKINYSNQQTIIENSDNLIVHYIDVGQGDSTFIELPNGESMLIDAGEENKGELVEQYIKKLGYKSINYIIGTHPHSDHIGGLSNIIQNFEIEKIYMPYAVSNSKIYEKLLSTIKNKGLSIKRAKTGVKIIESNDFNIYFLSPLEEEYSDLNNYSAVIKIDYKNRSFLFMGDAEKLIENEIKDNIKADVIKIAHHGSNTSSSINFVKRVHPKYAIISVGENNKYNHPDLKIISRWEEVGAKVYRTDLSGNIVITSNGNDIIIKD